MTATKELFLKRVQEAANLTSVKRAEEITGVVFAALKETMQSEDIEERIIERLPVEIAALFESPSTYQRPAAADDDVVAEGHEVEETVITLT